MRGLVIAAAGIWLAAGAAQAQMPSIPVEALQAAGLDPRTKVEGEAVQVMTGQRAVIRLDEAGRPALDDVEAGHPA